VSFTLTVASEIGHPYMGLGIAPMFALWASLN